MLVVHILHCNVFGKFFVSSIYKNPTSHIVCDSVFVREGMVCRFMLKYAVLARIRIDYFVDHHCP